MVSAYIDLDLLNKWKEWYEIKKRWGERRVGHVINSAIVLIQFLNFEKSKFVVWLGCSSRPRPEYPGLIDPRSALICHQSPVTSHRWPVFGAKCQRLGTAAPAPRASRTMHRCPHSAKFGRVASWIGVLPENVVAIGRNLSISMAFWTFFHSLNFNL